MEKGVVLHLCLSPTCTSHVWEVGPLQDQLLSKIARQEMLLYHLYRAAWRILQKCRRPIILVTRYAHEPMHAMNVMTAMSDRAVVKNCSEEPRTLSIWSRNHFTGLSAYGNSLFIREIVSSWCHIGPGNSGRRLYF